MVDVLDGLQSGVTRTFKFKLFSSQTVHPVLPFWRHRRSPTAPPRPLIAFSRPQCQPRLHRRCHARSVARLQSAVACGGEVDGVRLLSPQTIDRIFEVQSDGIDLVIGTLLKFGVGYSLVAEGRVCAWGGMGGSTVIIDVDRRITFAYVMNKMTPYPIVTPIAAALVERVYDILN